jgi:hypothetical protein
LPRSRLRRADIWATVLPGQVGFLPCCRHSCARIWHKALHGPSFRPRGWVSGTTESVLKNYTGLVDLVHLKDNRIGDLPEEALTRYPRGDQETWQAAWTDPVECTEVGAGNLDWRGII